MRVGEQFTFGGLRTAGAIPKDCPFGIPELDDFTTHVRFEIEVVALSLERLEQEAPPQGASYIDRLQHAAVGQALYLSLRTLVRFFDGTGKRYRVRTWWQRIRGKAAVRNVVEARDYAWGYRRNKRQRKALRTLSDCADVISTHVMHFRDVRLQPPTLLAAERIRTELNLVLGGFVAALPDRWSEAFHASLETALSDAQNAPSEGPPRRVRTEDDVGPYWT